MPIRGRGHGRGRGRGRGHGRGLGHGYENIINPFQMVQPASQAPPVQPINLIWPVPVSIL